MRRFIVPWVCIAAAACSGRAHDAGPTTRPEPGGSARADGAGGSGGPGGRPSRPLDAALLDDLAAVRVAGHDVTIARRGTTELATMVAALAGGRVAVTVSACLACTPIELPAWEARRAEFAALWAPAPESSGDRLDLSAPTIAGRTVIAIDAIRTIDGEARQTYQLHWNDGAMQLAALCESAARIDGDGGAATTAPSCAAPAATALGAYLAVL